jgi:hypothetical protein
MARYYLNIVAAIVTLQGVTALPSNKNLDPRFGRSSGSNKNNE